MNELKPCPFCGGEAKLLRGEIPPTRAIAHFIKCQKCGCNLISRYQANDVISEWNTRAPCDKCARIEKWADHVGCTPNKAQRYNILLEYVKDIAASSCYLHAISSRKILKGIGESND